MKHALHLLSVRSGGRRLPKAFYLGPEDLSEFMASDPPMIDTVWGNNPPKARREPAFEGYPVREAGGRGVSMLYDHTTAGRPIPRIEDLGS